MKRQRDCKWTEPILPVSEGIKSLQISRTVRNKVGFLFVLTSALMGSTSPAQLELRGIIQLDESYLFSIYNSETGASIWLSQGSLYGDLEAIEYDSSSGVLNAKYFGEIFHLSMAEAKLFSLDIPIKQQQLTGSERSEFDQAVTLAATYVADNPESSFLDAPLPRGIRSNLIKSKKLLENRLSTTNAKDENHQLEVQEQNEQLYRDFALRAKMELRYLVSRRLMEQISPQFLPELDANWERGQGN